MFYYFYFYQKIFQEKKALLKKKTQFIWSNSCFLTTQENASYIKYHVYIFFFLKHPE